VANANKLKAGRPPAPTGTPDFFSYASNQYRALQQFFKCLAAEDGLPDPMDGLRPPHVAERPVPVFAGRELSRLERLRGPRLRAAARRGDHRGAQGVRHPVRPERPAPRRR